LYLSPSWKTLEFFGVQSSHHFSQNDITGLPNTQIQSCTRIRKNAPRLYLFHNQRIDEQFHLIPFQSILKSHLKLKLKINKIKIVRG